MQILEYSPFGLRSVRIVLESRESDITVTLFPMVHLGEAAFFASVYEDAFAHDVVLVEGVRSPITQRITRVYRWCASSSRLALSLQPPYPLDSTVRARVIHADLTGEEFAAAWGRLLLWMRLALYVGSPAMALWLRIFGTRQMIAKHLAMDDALSQDELVNWSPETGVLDEAMLNARDTRLIERLEDVLDSADPAVQRVAIVYGAGHVRAVLRALTGRRRFFAKGSEWLTVFSL